MAGRAQVAEIILWGATIGALSSNPERQLASFQYSPTFQSSSIELAPLTMPLSDRIYSFPELNKDSFLGLGKAALEEQFRRMVFNVAARNQDDHTKNIASLMNKNRPVVALAGVRCQFRLQRTRHLDSPAPDEHQWQAPRYHCCRLSHHRQAALSLYALMMLMSRKACYANRLPHRTQSGARPAGDGA